MAAEFAGLLQLGDRAGYAGCPSTLMTLGGSEPPDNRDDNSHEEAPR